MGNGPLFALLASSTVGRLGSRPVPDHRLRRRPAARPRSTR